MGINITKFNKIYENIPIPWGPVGHSRKISVGRRRTVGSLLAADTWSLLTAAIRSVLAADRSRRHKLSRPHRHTKKMSSAVEAWVFGTNINGN